MTPNRTRPQTYDADLLARGLTFLPWEGAQYRQGLEVAHTARRILVLGESHYDPGRNDELDTRQNLSTFTRRNVLLRMAQPTRADSFWRRIERLFGTSDSPENIRAFWESIAFVNLVQDLLPSSDVRNLEPYWPRACECLAPALEALAPEGVIVLGAAAWAGIDGNHSRNTGRHVGAPIPRKHATSVSRYSEIWTLNAGERSVPAIHITHPMWKGGFRVDDWRAVVQTFLTSLVQT